MNVWVTGIGFLCIMVLTIKLFKKDYKKNPLNISRKNLIIGKFEEQITEHDRQIDILKGQIKDLEEEDKYEKTTD